MARIDDLLDRGTTLSFEFFPPRDTAGEERLAATLDDLAEFDPSFVSVTYGAGGSTRERTSEIVEHLLRETTLVPMAHLTSVSHTRAEIATVLQRHRDAGVENLMLLGGDPPRDAEPVTTELEHAVDLVRFARELAPGAFAIGVAAQPEGHPLSRSLAEDRDHLVAKLEEADFGVTQFFFEDEVYRRMVDELAQRGCTRPVVPGIMPVTNIRQIRRFAELSGADFPSWLAERLHAAADPDEVVRIGVDVATELCARLLDAGAPGLHFYTLNRSGATRRILEQLTLPAR